MLRIPSKIRSSRARSFSRPLGTCSPYTQSHALAQTPHGPTTQRRQPTTAARTTASKRTFVARALAVREALPSSRCWLQYRSLLRDRSRCGRRGRLHRHRPPDRRPSVATLKESGKNILPLCVDLAHPTPSAGWENRENASFLSRCSGHFDTVMMLAVIHHLLLRSQIPMDRIAAFCSNLTTRHLILEWVPPTDSKFQGTPPWPGCLVLPSH